MVNNGNQWFDRYASHRNCWAHNDCLYIAGTALLTLILFIKFPVSIGFKNLLTDGLILCRTYLTILVCQYISIALKVLASELHIYRTLVTGKL